MKFANFRIKNECESVFQIFSRIITFGPFPVIPVSFMVLDPCAAIHGTAPAFSDRFDSWDHQPSLERRLRTLHFATIQRFY
jgi:hypothetical protein